MHQIGPCAGLEEPAKFPPIYTFESGLQIKLFLILVLFSDLMTQTLGALVSPASLHPPRHLRCMPLAPHLQSSITSFRWPISMRVNISASWSQPSHPPHSFPCCRSPANNPPCCLGMSAAGYFGGRFVSPIVSLTMLMPAFSFVHFLPHDLLHVLVYASTNSSSSSPLLPLLLLQVLPPVLPFPLRLVSAAMDADGRDSMYSLSNTVHAPVRCLPNFRLPKHAAGSRRR